MSSKDFKVKNKLQVAGITSAGPLVSDVSGNIDSAQYVATQYGGTGTTTSPNSGQILYSSSGTTYTPTTLSGLPGTYAVGNTASRPGSPITGQIYSNTQTGYIEVYTSAGWSQLGVIPISATIGSPTDVGTNITYGSGSVDVAFTPASTGGLASSFTAISTPGSISTSGSSSPLRVTGLTQGTSYIFTVTATNGYGNALASNASSSITPTSLPQAPTIGTATNVTGVAYGSSPSATVTLTPGATGGKSISNYKYSTDGTTYTAFSPAQTSSPFTVPSLTSGTSYTFRLKSVTANGDSVASSESNSITATTVPQAPTIGTATVTNATTVSIPFTAGATGGPSITSYTATSSPSIALTVSGTSTPLTVTGTFAGGTAYTIQIVAVNDNGSSTASSASNSITPYAYVVGGTGPGGGKIFYDAGSTLSWGRYMEVAPSNWSGGADPYLSFGGNPSNDVSRGGNADMGVGITQTNQMFAAESRVAYVAGKVRSYTAGGFTWSLPSIGDMYYALHPNRALLGSFIDGPYWSSTQYYAEASPNWWKINLGNANNAFGLGGSGPMYVRPVRYF